jgi:hypothetical protein
MSNAKTNQADHNRKSLQLLLADFAVRRQKFIYKLENFDPGLVELRAIHPRLKTRMRAIDVAYFTAEHDDHHLTSIRLIMKEHKL